MDKENGMKPVTTEQHKQRKFFKVLTHTVFLFLIHYRDFIIKLMCSCGKSSFCCQSTKKYEDNPCTKNCISKEKSIMY